MTDTDPGTAKVPDLVLAMIRTYVPIAVGCVLAWIAVSSHLGDIPPGASATVGVVLAGACATGYHGLAKILEEVTGRSVPARIARGVARFMFAGVVAKPTYVAPPAGT